MVSDLARHLGVTVGTMSLSADRLQRAGYIVRERDSRDRRRVGLRLTPGGVRIREANSVLEPSRVGELLSRIPPSERRRALNGLAVLADAAAEMARSGPKSA